jgi:hypothetical protein
MQHGRLSTFVLAVPGAIQTGAGRRPLSSKVRNSYWLFRIVFAFRRYFDDAGSSHLNRG